MAMAFTVSISAQSQKGERREMNVEEMATRQAKQVKSACTTLSDEQYNAIYKVYLNQAQQRKAERDSLKALGNNSRPKMDRSAMQARQEKVNEQIKAILTADQYAAFEKVQKNSQNRMKQRTGKKNKSEQ